MNRFCLVVLTLALLAGGAAAQAFYPGAPVSKDKNAVQTRNLVGQVLDQQDAPITEAIVYLKNTKTLTIKSFITEKDGAFRFHGLSPEIDYEIYAAYHGQKSSTKTLSSFDTRQNVTMNLRIEGK